MTTGTQTLEPEEVQEESSGYVDGYTFAWLLKDAIRLNDGHTVNRLLDYVQHIKNFSFLYVPGSIKQEMTEEMHSLRIRLAGMEVMESLRNSEDFSPDDIEIRLGNLFKACNRDTAKIAEALAGAR